MKVKAQRSEDRVWRRQSRLATLRDNLRKQINDADCLLATLDEYCRENPDDCACVANDPTWREQIARQRDDLSAMLMAVRES